MIELNIDAAISAGKKLIGLGVVIRDDKGSLLMAKADRMAGCLDVLSAEALAMLCGLKCVADLGLQNVWVESDSQVLITTLKNDKLHLSPQGDILAEIKFG